MYIPLACFCFNVVIESMVLPCIIFRKTKNSVSNHQRTSVYGNWGHTFGRCKDETLLSVEWNQLWLYFNMGNINLEPRPIWLWLRILLRLWCYLQWPWFCFFCHWQQFRYMNPCIFTWYQTRRHGHSIVCTMASRCSASLVTEWFSVTPHRQQHPLNAHIVSIVIIFYLLVTQILT